MTETNKNLVLRIVSAIALAIPVVFLPVWRKESTALLVAAACAVLASEFYTIALRKLGPAQYAGMAASAALPLALAFWPAQFATIALVGLAALLVALFAWYLLTNPSAEAPSRIGITFTGVVYCGLLLSAAVGMRELRHGVEWIFLTLLVTFANDTGAYASGRAFGRHKLYPKVSPGKTWEGFAGGMVSAVLVALAVKGTFFPSLGLLDCLLVAVPTSILGPLGDLSESMLKRAYGVKDSGTIMPGHGGLLDRVDALLFNIPYVFLYAVLSR